MRTQARNLFNTLMGGLAFVVAFAGQSPLTTDSPSPITHHLSPITYHPSPITGVRSLLSLHWVGRWPLALKCAYAAVPWMINYQGRLTDSGGKSVQGSISVTFRLYDAATGGTTLWTEIQDITLAVADSGIFNCILGSVTSLSGVNFDSPMWLSVQVSGDTEMTPRQRLTASGYAMNSDKLDGLDSTSFVRSDADTSSSGKLTLTRAGTALVITPSSAPAADTKLLDVQNAAGTSKFNVDLEGDTTVAGDLTVTGTMSGSTSITGTTNASWNLGSGTDATASNVSLLFGQSSGQESIVFQGASTDDFVFSDDVRLDAQSSLRLVEASANGTDYVALKAPSSIATPVTWTLPSADGSADQVLTTSGSGTLSWKTTTAIGGTGTITGVIAGTGLTGGGTTGDVTLTLSTPVSVANGGTGAATLTSNGVLYGSGTSAIAATSAGTTGTVLHGNTSAVPSFSAVSLTADVSGTLPLANGGTNASLSNCTSGQALTVTSGAVACTSTITSNDAGTGTTSSTFKIDSDATGSEPADGAGLIIEGGTGDVNLTWVAADDRVKFDQDFMIDTAVFANTSSPRGGLFIAEDTTASNSAGAIFLGRRSAETSGWNILQGKTNGKLFWNGSELEIEGDSPASMTFGNSTNKVSLTYDPSTDAIWFSKGIFSQQFRNLVKNGSFEAFSALETFGASTATGGSGGSGQAFKGGWSNFAPDEWLWEAGKVFQHAPNLFTPGTTITATSLQQDYFHGKSAVTMEDATTALTDGPYNASKDAASSYSGVNDAHIEQTITGLKPSTVYAVGAYMRRLSATAEAIVDVTGEETSPTTTLGAALVTDDSKMTIQAAAFASFPNNGILIVESERISYTGKESPNLLTSLIRGFDGTTAAAHANGTAVTFAPFKHLTTSGSATPTVYTLYKAQFVTTPRADDIKLHLICFGTTSGDQCRFDGVQMVEGRSVPEFQPSAIVDTGDQTMYGSLRMGRTADNRGGILSVDKALRTRAIEFFEKDPGMSGTTGGFGGIGSATKIGSGVGSTITLTSGGSFFGTNPRDILVTITQVSPAQFKWEYRDCFPATGCAGSYALGGSGLNVSDYAALTILPGSMGITIAFANTSTVTTSDQWSFWVAGMNMAAQYNSYSGTASYTPGNTRIYKDPFNQKLTFQDGSITVTLDQIASSGIGQPARVDYPMFFSAATGAGQMFLNTSQGYTGSTQVTFDVEICANGSGSTRDSYQWRDNVLNGGQGSASGWDSSCAQIAASGGPNGPFAIPGGGGSTYGFTVTFGSPAGTWQDGNIGDRWQFMAFPATGSSVVKTISGQQGVSVTGTGDSRTVGLITTCGNGEILKYNTGTSSWGCAPDANSGGTGSVTSVTAGTGLTASPANPITTTGTLAVDVGTTANKIVQLDGTGKLPAVDGSQLTSVTAANLVAASSVVADAEVDNNLTISGGTIDNSIIGGTTPAAATFGGTGNTVAVAGTGAMTYAGTAQPKRTIVLTASGAIVPASNAPQQLQTNGTNLSYYTLNYSGTAGAAESAYWEFIVPDAYTGTTINATLYWLTPSTTTTNVVKWFVDMNGFGNAQTLDAALNTAGTVTGNPTATANQVLVTSEIANITSGWTAGKYAVVRVQRNAADAADTETALAKLLMIKLEWTASAESD